jgi:hypothetical protein
MVARGGDGAQVVYRESRYLDLISAHLTADAYPNLLAHRERPWLL